MNATRKEKKMRKLIAVTALAAALAACGGGSAGLHDPVALGHALAAQGPWDKSLNARATCTELDGGTFTCTLKFDHSITLLGQTYVEGTESHILHARVSEDGRSAEVTSPDDYFDTYEVTQK